MVAKSYNRTVRAHKLMYEALWRILWDKFVNWAEDSSVDINPDIMEAAKSVANEMRDKSSADAVRDEVNEHEEILADTDMSGMLKEFEKDSSPSFTYMYWRQCMELVSLLKRQIPFLYLLATIYGTSLTVASVNSCGTHGKLESPFVCICRYASMVRYI